MFAILLLVPIVARASAYTAVTSGNIDNPATFGGSVPNCASGGDTVTVNSGVTLTFEVPCIIGNSPSSGFVLNANQNSSVVIAPGVQLTLRGGFMVGGGLTLQGGSIINFDASQAPLPSTTNYWMQMGAASKAPYPLVQTTGTSLTKPASIESNSAAGAACIGPGGTSILCGTGGWGNVSNWNVSYLEFTNMGNSSLNSLVVSGSSSEVETFNNVIWNNCGETQFNGFTNATSGLNVTNSAWQNSQGPHSWEAGDASVASSTVTRQIVNSAFDTAPEIGNGDLVIENDYFDHTWFVQGAGAGSTTFEYNLVRNPNGNQPTQLRGTESYNYFLTDYWPSPTVTSTATSAGTKTLTDTAQSWKSNAYAASTSNGWMVLTTAGTGADQLRMIIGNTANTLTVTPSWTTIPDATTQYAIYDGIGNVHMLAPNSGVHTGDIGEFTGAYGTGKVFLNSNLTAPITISYTLTLPNGAGGNSAGLYSFGTSNAASTVTTLHNTVYVGGFVGTYVDDYLDNKAAGYLTEYENNLFWTNADDVSNNQCGSVKIEDNQHCYSGGPLNYGLPANFDYNGGWNLNRGTYWGNGYSLNLSSEAGQHDVNLEPDDGPNFVDPTRGFVTWCKSLGLSGTRPTVIANCRYQLLHANDFNGAGNPAFNVGALYSWVWAGYAPQNILLHNAAGDRTDIGAVPYQAPQ